MNNFRLTPRAYEDLKQIARYTLTTWGTDQREKYLRELDARFSWLAERPQVGRHRVDIAEGYYSYRQGSHIIFYLIRDGGIDIIGIPHRNRDTANYFNN